MPARYSLLPPARFGLGAILAIAAAVISIIASCAGHWLAGLILAIVAIPMGLVGAVRAISPEIRGGLVSIIGVALGIVAVIVAILELIFHISRRVLSAF